jgi:predicted MFS family arabinose efflux permease
LRSNRDFQLLWSGQAVSTLGSAVSSIAYPLLVLSITNSPAAAGIARFLGTLPYILFQLPAGAVVDRVNRRRLMIACDVGRLLALASIPLSAWFGLLSVAQIVVVAFIEATLFVMFRLAEQSAVRMVVNPEHYSAALSQNEARIRMANLLGTPIGGFLFDLGRTLPFLADAVSYLISLVTLVLIRAPFEEARTAERRHVLVEIREGVSWLWGQPYILIINLVASASNLIFQIVALVVIVAQQHRGASGTMVGLTLAGFGLGGLAGSVAGGWRARRLRPNTIVLMTVWLWVALTPLVGLIGNTVLLIAVLGALSFMGAVWNIAGNTIYFRLVPDRLIGRVSSVASLTSFGALPLGALAAGLLVQAFGPAAAGLVAGAGMLLLAAITTAVPSVRKGPAV